MPHRHMLRSTEFCGLIYTLPHLQETSLTLSFATLKVCCIISGTVVQGLETPGSGWCHPLLLQISFPISFPPEEGPSAELVCTLRLFRPSPPLPAPCPWVGRSLRSLAADHPGTVVFSLKGAKLVLCECLQFLSFILSSSVNGPGPRSEGLFRVW